MESPPESVKPGLEGVYVKESGICFVDGQAGRLLYCGYDIADLAEGSTFEETAFILWNRRLPTRAEYDELRQLLAENRPIPEEIFTLMREMPKTAHPMDVLRSAVSALASYDPELNQRTPDANVRKAVRLTAKFPTITAAYHRIRQGLPVIEPDQNRSIAADFLRMITGRVPDDLSSRVMDLALILHAEHSINASTFAAVSVASTLTDLYSAVVSGISSLKGPLHGGANEEVMKMLLAIRKPERAEEYVKNELAAKRKVFGFGHRVYKSYDPRAKVLREYAERLSHEKGHTDLYLTAEAVEKAMVGAVGEKGIYPNVDFYSGIVYHMMGIPHDLFTPIFATARITGWTAHVLEYWEDNRIMRPLEKYTGPMGLEYVPLNRR